MGLTDFADQSLGEGNIFWGVPGGAPYVIHMHVLFIYKYISIMYIVRKTFAYVDV